MTCELWPENGPGTSLAFMPPQTKTSHWLYIALTRNMKVWRNSIQSMHNGCGTWHLHTRPLVLSFSHGWSWWGRPAVQEKGFSAIYKVESALQCHPGLVEMLLVILSPLLLISIRGTWSSGGFATKYATLVMDLVRLESRLNPRG